jgi:hypothetical protein
VQSESLVQPSSWPEVEFRYILFPICVLLNFGDFFIIRWTDRFSLSISLSLPCVLEYSSVCLSWVLPVVNGRFSLVSWDSLEYVSWVLPVQW